MTEEKTYVPLGLPFALDEGATLPTRAHERDAGYDLALCADVRLERDHITMCHTGVHVDMPWECCGLLFVRSSLGCRGVMLATGASVIDAGYHGEIGVPLVNLSDRTVALRAGDRIAQLVIVPCYMTDPVEVTLEELSPSDRGSDGFGSTGR